MKRTWIVVILALLLAGCGAEETYETVADEFTVPVAAPLRQVCLILPSGAASPVVESEHGALYLCDGYEIGVQTLEAGNLDETLRTVCGYGADAVTVLTTRQQEGVKRYEFVWACTGEMGEQVGRSVILDDGNYHYVVWVLGPAEKMGEGEAEWSSMLSSFALA